VLDGLWWPVDKLQFKSLPCWIQEGDRKVSAWFEHTQTTG